jgi:hypothetical protein
MVIPSEAPDWTSAACLGVDGEIFFASEETRGSKRRQARIDRAMELCGRCSIRRACLDCLDFALANDDPGRPYGIWGGTTGTERERLRRRTVTLYPPTTRAKPRAPGVCRFGLDVPLSCRDGARPRASSTDPDIRRRRGCL